VFQIATGFLSIIIKTFFQSVIYPLCSGVVDAAGDGGGEAGRGGGVGSAGSDERHFAW
jgi:hypothetical protein